MRNVKHKYHPETQMRIGFEECCKTDDYAHIFKKRIKHSGLKEIRVKRDKEDYQGVEYPNHEWVTFETSMSYVRASMEWLVENEFTVER